MSLLLAFILDDSGVGLAGQGLSTSQGTLSVTVVDDISISGQSSSVTQGNVVVQTSKELTGQAITSSAGSLSSYEDMNYSITGQLLQLSTTAPSVTAVRDVTYNIIGTQLVSTYGGTYVVTTESVSVTGQEVAVGQGTLTASVAGAISVNLTGQGLTSSAGTPSVQGIQNVLYSMSGQSVSGTVGVPGRSISDTASVVGVQFTSNTSAPTVQIKLEPNVSLSGVEIETDRGHFDFLYRLPISGQGINDTTGTVSVSTNYTGYPVTAATALTTTDSVFTGMGFSPADGDRAYWPNTVNSTTLVPETNAGNSTGRIASGPDTGSFITYYFRNIGGEYYTREVTLVNGQATNIFLSGQNLQSFRGFVSVVGQTALTGGSITASEGALNVTVSDLQLLTSSSSTALPGALNVTLEPSVALPGRGISAVQGDLTPDTVVGISGQEVTASEGSFDFTINATVPIFSQTVQSSRNSISIQTGSSVEISGQETVSGQGTVTTSDAKSNVYALTTEAITSEQEGLVIAKNPTAYLFSAGMVGTQGVLTTADRLVYLQGLGMVSGTKDDITVIDIEIKDWKTPHFLEYVFGNVLQ
jgi:hypothetical protein